MKIDLELQSRSVVVWGWVTWEMDSKGEEKNLGEKVLYLEFGGTFKRMYIGHI